MFNAIENGVALTNYFGYSGFVKWSLLGNLSLPLMLQPGNTIGEAILEAKRQLAFEHSGREDVILLMMPVQD